MTTIPLWLVLTLDIAIFVGGFYVGRHTDWFRGWIK